MSLGLMLKRARFDKDLTLKEAAAEIKIAVSHLHAIEQGRKPRPKMETLAKLAHFYGLNYDDLCIAATRIPSDAFYKVIRYPQLLDIIRKFQA